MGHELKDKQIKESITIRGVCASIQSMAMPTLNNLIELFKRAGINLKIDNRE